MIMNHNHTQKGLFAACLANRAIRLGLLSLLTCFFFYPTLAQGQVRRLNFTVKTADDDLRGGQDNLNVAITLRDGREQWTKNVNHGQSWANQTTHTFDVVLQSPVALSEIASITFQTTFSGGGGGDNWNMGSVSVRAMGDGIDKVIVTHGFMRFTGEDKSLLLPVVPPVLPQPGKATKLEFTIKTGDDDLRGDGNNLDITIHFRDGGSQLAANINGGRNWSNGSTHVETINLNQAVDPSDIAEIDLDPNTWKGGANDPGFEGMDEWHMESISVRAIGEGVDKIIARHGYFRFKFVSADTLQILIATQVPGKASKLEFIFQTGGDDLRGDDDNLDVTILFRGGFSKGAPRINGGEAWKNNSTHTKIITLDQPVDPSDIVGVRLQTTFTGGAEGDNWDMQSVLVNAIGEGVNQIIARHGYFRFTKSQNLLSIFLTRGEPGKANKLELTIKTGGDDLRGDNDDLNITVFFRNGGRQIARNINSGKAWANGSTHIETITLNRAVDPANIVEIDLETTFSGGTGGDNWDMDSVTVKAVGEGVNEVLFRHGPRRFTHDDGILTLRRQ
jgi:hypothetical protein